MRRGCLRTTGCPGDDLLMSFDQDELDRRQASIRAGVRHSPPRPGAKWLLAGRSGDRLIVRAIHAAAAQPSIRCSSAPQVKTPATSSGTGSPSKRSRSQGVASPF
jgi:hypothetical protein